jgi:hypothetical protein
MTRQSSKPRPVCHRCRMSGHVRWKLAGRWYWLCMACDYELGGVALRWLGKEKGEVKGLLGEYREKLAFGKETRP